MFVASRAAPDPVSRQQGQTVVALDGVGGLVRLRSSMRAGIPCKHLDGAQLMWSASCPCQLVCLRLCDSLSL